MASRESIERVNTALSLPVFLSWVAKMVAGATMPQDPYIREKFTRQRITAKKIAAEYFERFPKERYQTEVESWRHLLPRRKSEKLAAFLSGTCARAGRFPGMRMKPRFFLSC